MLPEVPERPCDGIPSAVSFQDALFSSHIKPVVCTKMGNFE